MRGVRLGLCVMGLAEEITRRSATRRKGRRAQCAEGNPRGGVEKKEEENAGSKSLEAGKPSVREQTTS